MSEQPKAPREPALVIPVLARGKGFAVVDKPAGLPVDGDGADCVKLLARQLGPPGGRAWPRVVHRLDRDTTGCLVVALDQRSEQGLKERFDRGEVDKRYLALVRGAPPETQSIDTPFGPDPNDRRRHTTRIDTPRRARLSYEVRERFRVGTPAECALLAVTLDTGRTHQIRVQLSEGGLPILGDPLYGLTGDALDALAPGLAALLTRPGLHAEKLSFPAFDDATTIACTAPMPEDLSRVLERLR